MEDVEVGLNPGGLNSGELNGDELLTGDELLAEDELLIVILDTGSVDRHVGFLSLVCLLRDFSEFGLEIVMSNGDGLEKSDLNLLGELGVLSFCSASSETRFFFGKSGTRIGGSIE